MDMTGRKCGTCKHFEPAPMWRKGWCRNPLLFSPQQSHLVDDEDLDCERGMGNYWETMEVSRPLEPVSLSAGFEESVALAFSSQTSRRPHLVSEIGTPVYPVMGAAGQGGERPPYDEPPSGWSGGDPPSPSNRDYNYYPEERYWTDYLRIAAPILGVILLVVLFWWWITNFQMGDDDNGQIANSTSTVTIQTIGETPGADTTTTPATNETPGGITIPTSPPGTNPTNPPGEATQPPAPPSEIYVGATVEVQNTGGTGLNVRTEPSTEAEIVTVFADGVFLTIIGEAVVSEDLTWWPVSGDGIEGYVVQDYIFLVE